MAGDSLDQIVSANDDSCLWPTQELIAACGYYVGACLDRGANRGRRSCSEQRSIQNRPAPEIVEHWNLALLAEVGELRAGNIFGESDNREVARMAAQQQAGLPRY